MFTTIGLYAYVWLLVSFWFYIPMITDGFNVVKTAQNRYMVSAELITRLVLKPCLENFATVPRCSFNVRSK